MKRITGLVAAIAFGAVGNSLALSYSIDLNEVYSGATPQSNESPWLRATFEDIADGKVRLTMEALNLTGGEFVGSWFFNINPAVSAPALTFQLNPLDPGLVEPDAILHNPTGQNYKAGPEKYFDIQFANETANKPDRFTAGEKLIYDVGLIGGVLRASDFLYVNQQKAGSSTAPDDWFSAAHVQAIGTSASQSAWIGARTYYVNPEPAAVHVGVPDAGRTVTLLAVAFGALAAASYYRSCEKKLAVSQLRENSGPRNSQPRERVMFTL